jgi:hypothetical protein
MKKEELEQSELQIDYLSNVIDLYAKSQEMYKEQVIKLSLKEIEPIQPHPPDAPLEI